ncbi:hypothetical protein Hdeb2414_s0095g00790311 [Helianthus debilis subsp. tardiflorus]
MKDLSFFLLNKSHMKRGLNNLCTGHASTSTLNQQNSPESHRQQQQQPTLEEMIMQLDLEEKMAARPSLHLHHRMSCVNSSDILRSARNALNQYPRFSLDGKDAMYRSSFRNFDHGINRRLPAKVAGERVIWCRPGVVGRLMGLEAMPTPIRPKHKKMNMNMNYSSSSSSSSCLVRKKNLMRSSARQEEIQRTKDQVGWPMGRFM